MPRHMRVKVDDDRFWYVSSMMSWDCGEVVIPLNQIDGMTDWEIGETVRNYAGLADFLVAEEVADFYLSNGGGVRLDDDDFEQNYRTLQRHAGEDPDIDRALSLVEQALQIRARRQAQAVRRAHTTPGFIYVVRSGPYFKIGRTNKIERRMVQLGVQMPHPIEIVWTKYVTDMYRAEKYLHEMFAHKRLNGEWFDLDQPDLDAIAREYKD